jgi:nitrile hydratase subunit beta
MNGIHDMGGMHGMGPVHHEQNEPVFHERWEGRTFGLLFAMDAYGKWTLDALRHQIERIPPADYLRMRYYEKWITAYIELMIKADLVSRAEVESGTPAPGSPTMKPALPAAEVQAMIASGAPASRNVPGAPHFLAGQRVRARNINPVGHTRLPRYVRAKFGTVVRDHGVFVFPDTNAHGRGEKPQHVYSVRFTARELWGEQASARDSVYLDMWDDYLEPA